METKKIQQKLEDFLSSISLTTHCQPETIRASKDLFGEGFFDSLKFIRIIDFLESEFNIEISPFEITRADFTTLDNIVKLVLNKTNAS